VWSGELRYRNREGRPYWVSATIAPLLDENGQVERYLSIQTDITAQKNEERARVEAETRAATDVLTGLYNRRRLDQELEKAVERRDRYELDFSIMLLDMDHFKSVNDTYGHLVGDDVLITLADLLRQKARKVDTLGRWGGEEFLIICPGVDLDGARTLAERIRSAVETHPFETVGFKTISVGVASCTRDETITDLLARADAALYEAKESGRNRVIAR
ncbi:MAG: GGDEF domain-containing protein, partial [Arenicellales bacterium]